MLVEPHLANVQDRDGGGLLLQVSRPLFPFIKHVWADGGYNQEQMTEATNILVEIVRKQPDQIGFVVLPRRWVVERFFAWINRNRRLAKDFEAKITSAATFLCAASAMLLICRLARSSSVSKPTLRGARMGRELVLRELAMRRPSVVRTSGAIRGLN